MLLEENSAGFTRKKRKNFSYYLAVLETVCSYASHNQFLVFFFFLRYQLPGIINIFHILFKFANRFFYSWRRLAALPSGLLWPLPRRSQHRCQHRPLVDFARLQMGHLTFLGRDLNAHSPLWDTNQPDDARGEQLEDWIIAHSASVLNEGTATLLNRATGGLSSPDVSLAHPSLADKAEWTVSEDLRSDHLPITIELRCQTPVASDPHRRARWNTRDVNWQAFSEAVEETVRSFEVQDMNLRHRIRRLNRAMISAAAKHVGKSKPGRKTKP